MKVKTNVGRDKERGFAVGGVKAKGDCNKFLPQSGRWGRVGDGGGWSKER